MNIKVDQGSYITFTLARQKKGNDKYYFSSKKKRNEASCFPEGFEIYENINASVYIRKIKKKIIFDEELDVVSKEIQTHTKPYHYKHEAKGNIIIVYEVNENIDRLFTHIPLSKEVTLEKLFNEFATYSPIMRFILKDEKNRYFITERFCFRGSIDDWIYIGGPDLVKKAVKKYIKHLGKESFYDIY